MADLPPRPGDPLPPRIGRVGASPRAASMRDDPLPRGRDREGHRRRSPRQEGWRRSPPREDGWRRPLRDDDRYQDQPVRKTRDWEDRDRDHHRPRPNGSRVAMDTYVPDRRSPPPRRRSPQYRRRLSSRSRSPRSRERPPRSPLLRRPTPSHRPSHSRSPRRRRSSPYPRRPSSRERHKHWPQRSVSPVPHSGRHSPDHVGERAFRSPRFRSRAPSEIRDDEAHSRAARHRGRSRSKSTKSPRADNPLVKQETEVTTAGEKLAKDNIISPVRKLPVHPTPSGPRRPRTPTGPRARSPGSAGRQEKGKAKEISRQGVGVDRRKHDRSMSPPPRQHKRRTPSRSGSRSLSPSGTGSGFGSRSRSSSSSDSHSRSRFRSHSRSSTRSVRSRSPRLPSRSPSLSHSHRTRSERSSPRAPTGPRADRNTAVRDQNERKMLNIDDILPPLKPRQSKTAELDMQLKNIQEQRSKLEKEHVNVMRGVRRAQHELELAVMEQRSAEERRKAAERVHERTVRGFLEPIA